MPGSTSPRQPRPAHAAKSAPQGYFACVVDEDPRFHLDALRWYAALTVVAGVPSDHLLVHFVEGASSDVLTFMGSKGVAVRGIERFDARSPHCNKISGALRMAEDGIEGVAVLCDTDVAVLEDPRGIDLDPRSAAAKVVDAPVPPLKVLHSIFAAAGLTAPPPVPLPWGPGEWTVAGNCNGGLYVVPGALLRRVAHAWAHWAHWLLDRVELLEQWSVHVDQVSMALALTSEVVGCVGLDVRWNTPIHDPTRIPPDPPLPAVVHYHQEVDPSGLVRRTGRPVIDERIDALNTAIRDVWAEAARAAFSVPASRSDSGPDADGGLRSSLATLIDALAPASVLEVGIEGPALEADLVVHPAPLPDDPAAAEVVVGPLWHRARRALVVLAHAGQPGDAGYGGLLSALRRAAPDSEIYPLTRSGALVIYVLLGPSPNRHPRDVVPSTLDPLLPRHPDPLTLLVLRLHALKSTGFFPDHAPRVWEYPVVARLITEHLPAGSRLADVGAGVTPLAPFLASRSYVVETVDPSDNIRTWPTQPDWNEWGFLDYAAAGLGHRSWNCTLDRVPRTPPFDGIYSVSVIEHVPATVRRALLADISARTRRGGLVALTIDLVPGSDELWNLNLGVVVEGRAEHGTFQDVVHECAAVGLELLRTEVVRHWGNSRVDVALMVLHQSSDHAGARWRTIGRRVFSTAQRSRR